MKVKELLKTVNVAWSPPSQHPILLAAGTAAQQLDASFSTLSTLDLYSLNLQQPGYDMELKASVQSDHRFHKIIWGSHDLYQSSSAGIIVGGCDKGTIKIYSATKMLANDSNCLLSHQARHIGAVRAMDFNPFKSNLLATGATESEIFIWDIEKSETPMKPGTCSQPAEDVQHIAWNKQVQHILASTFSQRCVIWDLRKNEAIIKLTDANAKVRWKVVQWHPEVATQLCLASEDDQSPVIELWDLRFATSPLKILQNHQRGVLSIAWSPHDSDLLLSCSKDNRILCWNPNSDAANGEVICELAQTTQWNFDVSWCPRHPGLIVGSSFDGHAVVYSLLGGRHQADTQTSNVIVDSFPGMDPFTHPPPHIHTETTAELRKAPKWLKKPFGVSFGFGGKLTIFENEPADPSMPPNTNRKVFVSQVVTNPDLIQRSNELECALKSGQYGDYCRGKVDTTDDDHEKKVWKCIGAYFEENVTEELLLQLGYDVKMMNNKLNQFVPQEINDVTQAISKMGNVVNGNSFDGSAAFDVIAQQEQSRNSPVIKPIDNKNFEINTSDDQDGLITQAILVNNIEAAVSLCFANKRYADAIILSMAGGTELLARAQYRYFSEHSGALNSLINSLVSENWSDIVNNCDISCWKETLVGIFVHCAFEERSALCDALGDRLLSSDDSELRKQAQICYICSGNLNKTIDATNSDIEEIVELASVMQKALEYRGTQEVKIEGKIATVMATYAEMLATEGSFEAALSFLGNSQEPRIALLRERLKRALGYVQTDNSRRVSTRSSGQSYFDQMRRTSQQSVYGSIQQPQQQWNTSPTKQPYGNTLNQFAPPPVLQYGTSSVSSLPSQPLIQDSFNSQQPNSYGQMLLQPANQPVSQLPPLPPPPATTTTTSRPSSVGPQSRSKYIIDPSVKSAPTYGAPTSFSQQSPQMFPTSAYTPQNSYQPTSNMYQTNQMMQNTIFTSNESDSLQSSSMTQSQIYNPGRSQQQQLPPQMQDNSIYKSEPQPWGWNDPPNIKSTRVQQEKTEFQPQDPILHPLRNAAPQTDPNMMPYEGYYPDSQIDYNQQQYSQLPVQQQFNKPAEIISPSQPTQLTQSARAPKAEIPKAPIPDEHMHLKTVLDELRVQCYENARNPQTKRKIEDVSKKLEVLYDCLRENKLSQSTLQGLHQITHCIQSGDYTGGLGLHTQLVSGSDFSQIASFMPGIKVLLQSALQLGVYIR